jgi:RND family efflux transporter MFP subunit
MTPQDKAPKVREVVVASDPTNHGALIGHVGASQARRLAALIAAALLLASPAFGQQPSPSPVTVAKPLQRQVTEWDEFTGQFEAVERVEVRARVSGVVSEVHFRDGQSVQKGALLFTIDRRPFYIAVEQATAARREAQATLRLAENEVDRARPLVEKGHLAKSEYDARLARQLEAEARLQQAEARLKQAELDLEWSEVRAPVSGRVSDARVDVGNLISGGEASATLLTTIVSLDPIHFLFVASEADYIKYLRLASEGRRPSSRYAPNPVAVRLSDEDDFVHRGKMDFADNEVDPNSGTIRGRAIFENKSLFLTPGMFGRMRLFGGTYDALLIPDEAVVSDQARKIVLTVEQDGTVAAKVVTLGPISDRLRVVRSGLQPDDRVIIAGIQRAKTGQKVTAEEGSIDTKRVAAQ